MWEVQGPQRIKTRNNSYNPSRGGISALRTSPTKGCEGRQDNVSLDLEEKRKDHMGGRDGGRKFPGKTYFPLPH